MRYIGSFENLAIGQQFSAWLNQQHIANLCEPIQNKDWGSDHYGTTFCKIWVYDEESVDQALKAFEEFKSHPETFEVPPKLPTLYSTNATVAPKNENVMSSPAIQIQRKKQFPLGHLTLFFLLLCSGLFILEQFTTPKIDPTLPLSPRFMLYSTVNQALMFDYPKTYALLAQFIHLYGYETFLNPQNLSQEAQALHEKILETPYWEGIYAYLIPLWEHPRESWASIQQIPLFEKIREGEVWRLLTPSFLHSDIFHLLFNMLWLIVLGRQMEGRLTPWRYVLFIVIAGVASNSAQYLMGGANFIGFSGILCAMLTFIWMRQRKAPWEGYDLQRSTFGLMMFFILMMAALQVTSFFTEWTWQISISPPIANTAHLSGALVGVVLGSFEFFRWKSRG